MSETFDETPAAFVIYGGSNNHEIGRLTWRDGIFRFEGNAAQSAHVFLQFLNRESAQAKENILRQVEDVIRGHVGKARADEIMRQLEQKI